MSVQHYIFKLLPLSQLCFKIKSVVFLKSIVTFVPPRPFGNNIHDLARKYNGSLVVSDFRKLEQLPIQSRKVELDVRFLKNCQAFGVYPKFITSDLPNVSNFDAVYIRKRFFKNFYQEESEREKGTMTRIWTSNGKSSKDF